MAKILTRSQFYQKYSKGDPRTPLPFFSRDRVNWFETLWEAFTQEEEKDKMYNKEKAKNIRRSEDLRSKLRW